MIINVDKEGYEALTQVLDIFIKTTGLKGHKLLNELSQSIKLIQVPPVNKPVMEVLKPDVIKKPVPKRKPKAKKANIEDARIMESSK